MIWRLSWAVIDWIPGTIMNRQNGMTGIKNPRSNMFSEQGAFITAEDCKNNGPGKNYLHLGLSVKIHRREEVRINQRYTESSCRGLQSDKGEWCDDSPWPWQTHFYIVKKNLEHNTAYYALIDKGFSLNEIRFIVDSISINKFLTAKQKPQLIKKVVGMCSDAEIR